VRTFAEIDRLISNAGEELVKLTSRCSELTQLIYRLRQERDSIIQVEPNIARLRYDDSSVTNQASQEAKIALAQPVSRS
jgi:hypothetical protein